MPRLNEVSLGIFIAWFCNASRSISVNAFHEKAGRSQVDSSWFLLVTGLSPAELPAVATLPSALSVSDWFARCQLGVLVAAGAAT